jgi:hypothetical protein
MRPLLPIVATFLAALLSGCQRPAPSSDQSGPDSSARELFRDIAASSGLAFTHANGAKGQFHMPEIMGAGAALFDIDGDGDLDAFLVQSRGPSKLFRNDLTPGAAPRFTDITAGSGIDYDGFGMGAAAGDADQDGRPDLLVTGWGETRLYRNLGEGRFARVPQSFPGVWSTSASFFDYDRDGRLDLIVLTYVNFSAANNKRCQAPSGEPDYCTPRAYSPAASRLYRNESGPAGIRFTDVTSQAGIDKVLGPGLGVTATDLNADGWPDLFVANDTAQNHVWINQKDGTFRELGVESGAAYSEDGLAKAGMGVAAGDYDQDGDTDLYVVNLMREGATLFRNDGVSPQGWPMFLDVTRQAGLYQTTFPFTGFGTEWFDYDNDGQLDLFMANGAVTLREEQRGDATPFKERNLLLRNLGQGRFADVTPQAGPALQLVEVSRGAAFGDVDNDGDVDILVTNNNGAPRLLENLAQPSGWISIRLTGAVAEGALVTLYREDLRPLVRRAHSDSSYCSASDLRVHFGLGDKTVIGAIEVQWPGGTRERWTGVTPQRIVTLQAGSGIRQR